MSVPGVPRPDRSTGDTCCPSTLLASCCRPEDKATCCGTAAGAEPTATCGCQTVA